MTTFLVAISEDPATNETGELSIDARMTLADRGFRQEAIATKVVWPAAMGFATGADIPDDLLEQGTIYYSYDAEDEASAASDALAIVGAEFNLRVTSQQ
jgi:hypothetical protein